jgi:hypothetical protein
VTMIYWADANRSNNKHKTHMCLQFLVCLHVQYIISIEEIHHIRAQHGLENVY